MQILNFQSIGFVLAYFSIFLCMAHSSYTSLPGQTHFPQRSMSCTRTSNDDDDDDDDEDNNIDIDRAYLPPLTIHPVKTTV